MYAVLLLFVLPIVNIVFGAFDGSGNKELYGFDKTNYLTCWTNAKDMTTINSFEKIAKFDGNGGTVYGGETKSCGGYDSCELKKLSRGSKKGYIFKGWSPWCWPQPRLSASWSLELNMPRHSKHLGISS